MRHVLTGAALAAALPAAAQEAPSVAPPAMQRRAPDLAADTDRVLFGDVWRRTAELSARDRSLVTVTALIASGSTGPLAGHLGRALDNGLTPMEVGGMATHLAWYTGWPNAVGALEVIDRVLEERGIAPLERDPDAAPAPLPASDPERAERVRQTTGAVAPKLAQLTNEALFAELWRRPDLSPRDRSLVTVVALATGGDVGQLGFHIGRAQENGLLDAEMAEAFTHLAFYAGWPKATAAVGALAEATQDKEQDMAEDDKAAGVTVFAPGQQPRAGPAEYFTGSVTVTSPVQTSGGSRLGGATVTFEPGARTNWHTHPLGQLLVVTQGEGRVQEEGGPVRRIVPGELVWIAPGVNHWHGAAPDSAMTHVALSESLDGENVTWGEPVDEATYTGQPGN